MRSAGILLYRRDPLEVFLGHPGGPYYRNKEFGVWTVPKGVIEEGEEEAAAALREFEEETGHRIANPIGLLGEARYRSGKRLIVFTAEHVGPDFPTISSEFTHTFPNRTSVTYPELDRGEFFSIEEAKKRVHPIQRPLIDVLVDRITHKLL